MTPTKSVFTRTINTLFKRGFVWTNHRVKSIKHIPFYFGPPASILLGADSECKMVVLSSRTLYGQGFRTTTLKLSEFLKLEESGEYYKTKKQVGA